MLMLLLCSLATGQTEEAISENNWVNNLDIYQKIFGGVVATVVTLFGLPLAYMNFKKTKAEIKKLELEVASIEGEKPQSNSGIDAYSVNIINSDRNIVKIMTDPRILAPLLLLLDFIIAWIVITLSSYSLDFIFNLPLFPYFISNIIKTVVMGIIYIILLVPIVREARRVKSALNPKKDSEIN